MVKNDLKQQYYNDVVGLFFSDGLYYWLIAQIVGLYVLSKVSQIYWMNRSQTRNFFTDVYMEKWSETT